MWYPQRSKEDSRFSEARVTGGHESPDKYARNRTQILYKISKC